ncbi:uncharacterized protein LOC109791999 [Cajanus cajan]|uniref:uncharacterized protein LOC109791999 n=1 Tax=Cajanus cajan TaxID=3821 RepID=UPI00098D813B|nr:uncharacterized protein LOC109791999 [Cajanus cajan]
MDLSETVRQLKQEMAAMKQQREKDVRELSALKAENAALKNQDPSWRPTQPTNTQTQVTLSTTDDAALCRIFPTSLKGRALSWFPRLPPNSIDSFNTLSSQFTIQFAKSRPHNLTSLSLISLRQDKKESLRTFMDRFNKVALEIRDLNPAVALHHLTTALKPRPFVNSICKKAPSDMNDQRRHADKYMQMEEFAEFRNQAQAETMTKNEKIVEQPFKGRNKEITLRERPVRGPKYSHYTPLNASRAVVLKQALASEVLAIPKRASTPPYADTNKSCRYHRNRGHSTEECAALKDKIEDLIKQGQLQNFVDRPVSSRPWSEYQPRHHERWVCWRRPNLVSPKEAFACRLSVHTVDRQPTRRLPSTMFTDADFQGIDPVQDDPMLGVSKKVLIPYDDPLVGFSGERVSTRRYIKLFTRFCFDEQEYREIQVKYIVVHANTSYNILLGRPSLNMLGAIVSTPHLAMKFPSDKGKILTIHADQKATRECYFASLRITLVEEKQSKSKRVHVVNPLASDELPVWDLDPRMNEEEHVEPTEEKIPLQINSQSSQVTCIGTDASEGDRSTLSDVIIRNKDLFAWTPSDMPGIDPNFMCHKLSICAEARPVAQRKRKMGSDRKLAVETEVAKLSDARFIR